MELHRSLILFIVLICRISCFTFPSYGALKADHGLFSSQCLSNALTTRNAKLYAKGGQRGSFYEKAYDMADDDEFDDDNDFGNDEDGGFRFEMTDDDIIDPKKKMHQNE